LSERSKKKKIQKYKSEINRLKFRPQEETEKETKSEKKDMRINELFQVLTGITAAFFLAFPECVRCDQ
jgi:hypothetical protein